MKLKGRILIPSIILLVILALNLSVVLPSVRPVVSAQTAPLLSDDFTRDTTLNTSLWVINGPVGSVMGPDDTGVNQIQLTPTFSPSGMTIAQINGSQEYGTIESISNFTPPFTATAVVQAVVSNGHTFGLGISTQNASTGVLVYGNVNSTNCSNLGNCGNPSTCGNSANSNIPPNQCYYGLDAKIGQGGKWSHAAKLYLTPSVNVSYTLQISVDAAGDAQYSVSQAGQLLGQGSAQIGTGPFYIIMEQVEGSPVAHPGPNEAIWSSISVTPTTTTLQTTTTSSTSTSSGFPITYVLVIVIIIILIFIPVLLVTRKRGFTVKVVDLRALSPILGAQVIAEGPKDLSGLSDKRGEAKFGSVKEGDYVVRAQAEGYNPSEPANIRVTGRTKYTVRLERNATGVQGGAGPVVPSQGPAEAVSPPSAQVPQSQATGAAPVRQVPAPAPQPEVAPTEDLEGFGGRIQEIIRTFQAKGAISPETALTAQELGLSRLFVRIMKRRRGKTTIFMEINGRYYLNQKALEDRK